MGKDLYERMAVLAEHLNDVGQALGKSVIAYNKAVGSLEARILPAARRFKELGVASDKEVPPLERGRDRAAQMSAGRLAVTHGAILTTNERWSRSSILTFGFDMRSISIFRSL